MDWLKIKTEYIAGGTSYRRLAEKYGVSFSVLRRVAGREGWTALREQVRQETDTKIVNSVAQTNAERSIKICDVADKLLDKISSTLDKYEVLNSQTIKHFTSALKDIRDIKGIKSEIDLREQEARIEKLRKETMSEDADSVIKVDFEGDVDKYGD